jgi:hypothetical protein
MQETRLGLKTTMFRIQVTQDVRLVVAHPDPLSIRSFDPAVFRVVPGPDSRPQRVTAATDSARLIMSCSRDTKLPRCSPWRLDATSGNVAIIQLDFAI